MSNLIFHTLYFAREFSGASMAKDKVDRGIMDAIYKRFITAIVMLDASKIGTS